MKNKVRYYRQELKITQEQLGKALGITRQTVSAIEHGRFDPPLTMACQLTKILKQPMDELFTFNGVPVKEIETDDS